MSDLYACKILDIICLIRQNESFSTVNKACDVISCRIEGESSFFSNGKSFRVHKGDVMYIPAGSTYSQKTDGETIICFHLVSDKPLFNEIRVFSFEKPTICRMFKQAYARWRREDGRDLYACMALLYGIFARLNLPGNNGDESVPAIIRPACGYLHAHTFDADLSIQRVYEQSYISRAYFNKIFKQHFGCTPIAHINRLRVTRAKHLLLLGNYSVPEIARLCGFDNGKYFYTVFKKMTGYTPGAYKKDVRKPVL